ncbi:phosphoenolpyruvate synthase/pyruvate phosphate dikinase [Candidatus Methanoperedens nitroreducens]|uniref:Probable phosphoenolpyruvate synthase n=1 Tax=Candidatus Methanoperedens nitratireducens TaxID=1392998 RepID=A0A062V7N9_9EURY|nr:PEP/pyruvate-binding domain-containing protein [Candidatus Methanoperedens nitroreducens]KCZ71385.1 phosphoenolpyruvate synthase/pyruvate phosphate dikinase [Candidatus Methanoperedens nitroreducens]MDJ1421014.1 PEP/pyruvate-binding domain-containing protein [Candidatus Methanoperedens sp.]
MEFIRSFEQLTKKDISLAGGKGANLGELVRAGFPVPPGFVVTTAAYDRFVVDNSLGRIISAVLQEEKSSGTEIRDAFQSAPIPLEIEQAILKAYRKFGQRSVAVRSSATAEDLPGAAFAGQQDTFLNVIGEEALLDAVRRCWASLWTDRAVTYRRRRGIDQRAVKLAIVIQHMVPADVAGVMFTANPVTGARDEIVIDANPGLGEAVVSGLVTPDHFVMRKQWLSWRIIERHHGKREVLIRPRTEGGTERVSFGSKGALQPALPDPALRQLARLGLAIQQHFGNPQDIEWVWSGGKFFIVQSRPITALPEPVPKMSKIQSMVAGLLAEMFAVRPYPLDATTWLPALSDAATSIFGLLGVSAPPFDQMFVKKDDVIVQLKHRIEFHLTSGIFLAPVHLLRIILHYNPVHWKEDPLLNDISLRIRDLEARELQTLSWKELLATMNESQEIFVDVGELRRRYYPRMGFAVGLLRLFLGLLGRSDHFSVLMSGVENKTVEANHALEALAAWIRANPSLSDIFSKHDADKLWKALEAQPSGRMFLVELKSFLDRYGHRESVLSTALEPTWKDAPEIMLGILKGLASTEARSQNGRPAWEIERDKILMHPLLRISFLRNSFIEILDEARCFLQLREDTHFYATLALPVIRRTLLEFGRRLVGIGVIGTPEDVFHFQLNEIEQLEMAWPPTPQLTSDLQSAVVRRKEQRKALEGMPLVDPRSFRQTEAAGDNLLRGTPGSPGIAEGTVRIILDASEFGKLCSGDVLVAPYTNPSWTPLFQRAVAVVVDTGGSGSHAAIVAREYGIPAVMGTVDGTRRLKDGERIRVDGFHGLVHSQT